MAHPIRLRRCAVLLAALLALLLLAACTDKSEESPSLVWCWAMAPPLGAQTVLLEGVALDGQGRPLPGVSVELAACSGPPAPLRASSDAGGRFRLELPLAEVSGCLQATSGGKTLALRDLPLTRAATIHALLIFKPSEARPVALLVDDRIQPPAQPQ